MSVKTVTFETEMQLLRQAAEAGREMGKVHRNVAFSLTDPELQVAASCQAVEAWRWIQRHRPRQHKSWSGAKPTFLDLYRRVWMTTYLLNVPTRQFAPSLEEEEPKRKKQQQQQQVHQRSRWAHAA